MPSLSQAGSKRPAAGEGSATREKILAAFSAKARRSGIRAVLMGDLASEVRMSAVTLYKQFASKDELVAAMVDAWALELAAIEALDWEKATSCSSALQVLLSWANAWTASLAEVSPAFIEDLRRDHPAAWRLIKQQIEERKQIASEHLTPFLREDVDAVAALALLDRMVMEASDARFLNRAGISRREAVRTAVVIWGGGALRQRATFDRTRPLRGL